MLRSPACLRRLSAQAFLLEPYLRVGHAFFRHSQPPLIFIRGSKYKSERPKRNLDIPHDIVYPVDPLTGELQSPVDLSGLVASINTKTHFVQLISEEPYATVKVLNIKEEIEKRKESKEQRKTERKAVLDEHLEGIRSRHKVQQQFMQERRTRIQEYGERSKIPLIPRPKVLKIKNNNSVETKEIQMTWGVEEADLEHKLNKAREELEKGHRVNIVIAPKSRQPSPPRNEMEKRIQGILDRLKDSGKEWQDRTFERRTAIIRLQKLRS